MLVVTDERTDALVDQPCRAKFCREAVAKDLGEAALVVVEA